MMDDYLDKLEMIPAHMRDTMRRYIERGIPTGSFLEAVLCNDLMGALGRADEENRAALHGYAVYLYSYAPNGCHGSPSKVSEWISGGGLAGREEEAA